MNCLHCAFIDLRTNPRHAEVGLSHCNHEPKSYVFDNFSKERDCHQFEQAEEGAVAKRVTWWEKDKRKK
jgi:hypothetical protein